MQSQFLFNKLEKYDPRLLSHREKLAEELIGNLMANFMLPKDIYGVKEIVFSKDGFDNPGIFIQCYSSVVRTRSGAYEAREVGSDAIRVIGLYKSERQGGILPLVRSDSRINRTGTIPSIIERTLACIHAVSLVCEDPPKCRNCGAPLFTSKAGREVCAEICWTRRNNV
jgi:hypothetical protein